MREVDLRKKFHMRASDLARALKLTEPKSKALRWHLGIDDDNNCCHVFEFGKSTFPCLSSGRRSKRSAGWTFWSTMPASIIFCLSRRSRKRTFTGISTSTCWACDAVAHAADQTATFGQSERCGLAK